MDASLNRKIHTGIVLGFYIIGTLVCFLGGATIYFLFWDVEYLYAFFAFVFAFLPFPFILTMVITAGMVSTFIGLFGFILTGETNEFLYGLSVFVPFVVLLYYCEFIDSRLDFRNHKEDDCIVLFGNLLENWSKNEKETVYRKRHNCKKQKSIS